MIAEHILSNEEAHKLVVANARQNPGKPLAQELAALSAQTLAALDAAAEPDRLIEAL